LPTAPIREVGLVELGLIKSYAHPGGNVTGLTLVAVELAAKRIQLLKEAIPAAVRVAVPWNPDQPINKLELNEATTGGGAIGLTVLPVEIKTAEDIEGAFSAMTRNRVDAVLLLSSPLTFPNRARLAELALKARLPMLVPLREYVEAGFLLSYGPSYVEHCRQAATYVDKILKGAKPADLPVQLPRTLQLVINLKTAKALGVTIPVSLLTRADEVIE
jgi:putative tryptophan/tyrosine transport system substrate-binding protein